MVRTNVIQKLDYTANVNANCIASTPVADQWKCIFAQYSYQYIKTPIFVLNSAYDSWQMQCIFTSEPVPENSTVSQCHDIGMLFISSFLYLTLDLVCISNQIYLFVFVILSIRPMEVAVRLLAGIPAWRTYRSVIQLK